MHELWDGNQTVIAPDDDDTSPAAFGLRIENDANKPSGIGAGDIIIVDPAVAPEPGQLLVVVAERQQLAVVGQLKQLSGADATHFQVVPSNELFAAHEYTSADPPIIVGCPRWQIKRLGS